MPRPALPELPENVVTARLPDGRHLIAYLDPTLPEQHSPLQRALIDATIRRPSHAGE